jgi:trans-2,3-dihydro-3-hydroxyanthranilate isomerase
VLAATDENLTGKLVLEEGVGPVEAEVSGTYARFTVTAPYESPADEQPPVAAVAAALSLPADAVEDAWYAGVGNPFCYVRLTDAETVDRAVLDQAAWSAGVADGWSPSIYFFAGEFRDGGRVHARSFAPAFGIPEDPATGSACTGLVASLAVRAGEPSPSLRIDQGVRMGRPSQIEATAHTDRDGRLTGVSVGGHTVIVGQGTITV